MTVLGSNPRASVDASHPDAFAICDRCGFLYNHRDLRWQMQWRGTQLVNIRLLVCSPCYDQPNESLRTIMLPPDPPPVKDARPPAWASQEGPTPPDQSVADLLVPE